MPNARMLLVEDDSALAELLIWHVSREDFDVQHTIDDVAVNPADKRRQRHQNAAIDRDERLVHPEAVCGHSAQGPRRTRQRLGVDDLTLEGCPCERDAAERHTRRHRREPNSKIFFQ